MKNLPSYEVKFLSKHIKKESLDDIIQLLYKSYLISYLEKDIDTMINVPLLTFKEFKKIIEKHNK